MEHGAGSDPLQDDLRREPGLPRVHDLHPAGLQGRKALLEVGAAHAYQA
jgi:hypothetical protein